MAHFFKVIVRAVGVLACLFASSAWADAPVQPVPTAGKDLYKAHCALCHGGKGQGVPPMFPDLNSKPVEAYAAMMQNYRAGQGHKVMVDMAKSLNEEQVRAILAHIASFPPKK
ncbi:MAG: c-type cytochrome [Pseudomonadota bacterium]